MPYQYKFHPAAQEEYESSVSWYLSRSSTAASNFVISVDGGLLNICNDPKKYRNEYKNYYEFILYKYPYTVIYTIEEHQNLIIIIAIYHQKRQPHNKYR